jgi:ABC-2 type transport system ATP-binding protein
VLILDEPTSGLDPNQTLQMRNLILELGRSKSILLSTHILAEVRAVCSRVILIHRSRVVLDGPVSTLGTSVEEMESQFHRLTAEPHSRSKAS